MAWLLLDIWLMIQLIIAWHMADDSTDEMIIMIPLIMWVCLKIGYIPKQIAI